MTTSLRKRLLSFQLLAVLVVFATLFFIVTGHYQSEKKQIQTKALHLTQRIKNEQLQSFRQTAIRLPLLARQLSHLDETLNLKESIGCNEAFANILSTYPEYLNLGLIDLEGNTLCSGLATEGNVWLGDRTYYLHALETGGLAVGDYQIGRITGKVSINFGYPYHDRKGILQGVIFAALDLDSIIQSALQADLPEESTLTLIGNDGKVLYHYPEEHGLTGKSALNWPVYPLIKSELSEGDVEAEGPQGVNRLYAFARIPLNHHSLFFLIGTPSHIVYGSLYKLYLAKLGFLFFVLAIMSLIYWRWTELQVLYPIRALVRASNEIKSGNLNSRSKVISTTAELTQLADTFDSMAETLARRYKDKVQHEKELMHVNRALRTLSAGNHAMLRATKELELLQEMCDVAVEVRGYSIAWVGYSDQREDGVIHPLAAAGIDKALIPYSQISHSENPEKVSASGMAVLTGKPFLLRRVNTENVSHLNQFFRSHNISTAFSLPLFIDGNVLGVFTIYSNDSEEFTPEECAILEEMSYDLAFGIKTLRLRKENEKAQKAIRKLAFYDSVTGLPNHIQLETFLNKNVYLGNGRIEKNALIIIGLDKFRDINNTLGFESGDKVLQETAQRLREAIAENEALYRMRGDEFAVIIPNAGAEEALAKAKRLGEILGPLFTLSNLGFSLSINASMGIGLIPDHGDTPGRLLASTDIALQYAKQTGNGYELYLPELDTDKQYFLALAGKLHRALENNELCLYYQPKVSIKTGKVIGFEALARWFPPNEKMIPPDIFIDLAEKTGMIRVISHWVIETALQQSFVWGQSGINLPIAINLSARNLHESHLINFFIDRAAELGVEKRALEIEITETAIMEDSIIAKETLNALREMGMTLYIDDFGTGQSSLQGLKQHPVSALKIDKSFVIDMIDDQDAAVIVETTIKLAHDLGLSVVAEGVENETIWNALKELKCDSAQGYYMARPMPPDEIDTWLKTSEYGLDLSKQKRV